MRTKTRIQVSLLFIVTIFLLTGCMSANEEFIQGIWYWDEPHLHWFIAEHQLEVWWTFDGGQFALDACCFNTDEHITGQYRVIEESEDSITIEIFNVIGSATKYSGQYKIVLDRENDTVMIMGRGPYLRLTPKE